MRRTRRSVLTAVLATVMVTWLSGDAPIAQARNGGSAAAHANATNARGCFWCIEPPLEN